MKDTYRFFVAGVKFHKLHEVIDDIEVGDELELITEPSNKYDPNAIMIRFNGTMLGYVPGKISSEVTSLMRAEVTSCTVQSIDVGAVPWERLEVEIKGEGTGGSDE